MKKVQFTPDKIFKCSALIKDMNEEFEIIYNGSKVFKMKKIGAAMLSNVIYNKISNDSTFSSYKLQFTGDDELIKNFFTQISSSNVDISLDHADQYLQIAKELEMPEVIEVIKLNSALVPIEKIGIPLIFTDYNNLLQSIAKSINQVPENWLMSISDTLIIDIYNQKPKFEDWNIYVRTVIGHRLSVHYLNEVSVSKLDLETLGMLNIYYIEMNSQERIAEVAFQLAKIVQTLQTEKSELNDLIEKGVPFDDEIDCTFIKTRRTYQQGTFWKCLDCCHGSQIICNACKNKCHAGHRIDPNPIQTNSGFCDCGAGDLPCKCQCMGRKNIIKVND